MRWVIAVVLACAGCLDRSANDCGGGIVCPTDKQCITGGGCAAPQQIAACSGLTDGTTCMFGRDVGFCIGGVCVGSLCGNGTLDPGEVCDWGEDPSCRKDCLKLAKCGDGFIDAFAGEQCDDGGSNADVPGAPCRTDCLPPRCGDGVLDPSTGEACEPGQALGASCSDFGYYKPDGLACNASCGYDTSACSGGRCGDHIVNGPELCDGAPPEATCLDFGYDVGLLGCAAGVCVPDFTQCESLSWLPVYMPPHQLYAIWGSGPSDIFSVGLGGTIVHFDGTTWSPMQASTTQDLFGVWGSGPSDVFAVGQAGTIVHYDGTSWSVVGAGVTTEVLRAVWGSGSHDVYAVGPDYAVLHYDGVAWSSSLPGPFVAAQAIWGSGPNDIYAGGRTLIHWNGTAWSQVPNLDFCRGFWGSASNDVYASCGYSGIWHFDGTTWHFTTIAAPYTVAGGLWGNDAGDVYATGGFASGRGIAHFDHDSSSTWSTMATNSGSASALWGSGRGDMYAVGDAIYRGGASVGNAHAPAPAGIAQLAGNDAGDMFGASSTGLVHYDGTRWSIQTWASNIFDLWLTPGGELEALTNVADTTLHFDGTTWTVRATGTTDTVYGIWGSGPDTFAVGDSGRILHLYADAWQSLTAGGITLYDVWGTSNTNIFAVGRSGVIQHFDGATWSPMTSGTGDDLFRIWGSGPNDVYAVGAGGAVVHYNGVAWSLALSLPSGAGVWGSGPNDVFVAEFSGTVVHWNGSTWSTMTTPEPSFLYRLWGRGPSDVYALGYNGAYHYDGSTWRIVPGSPAKFLRTIVGDATHIYVGGDDGSVMRYDGTTWTTLLFPGALQPVHGVGGGRAFALGTNGMARYDGTSWAIVAPQPSGQQLIDVWGSSSTDVFAVGTGGTILHWDGTSATTMTSPTTNALIAVWGSGPHDVFASASDSIIHYDGAAWSTMTTPPGSYSTALWGTGRNDVYAAGDANGLLHWDGTAWTQQAPATAADHVWGFAANDVYGLSAGSLRHWNGAGWEPVKLDGLYPVALWGDSASIFFLDGGGVGRYGLYQIVGHLHPRSAPP